MKKLLYVCIALSIYSPSIYSQENRDTESLLEQLQGTVAQMMDLLNHMNEKLNILQSGSESTTSKLTALLSQQSQHPSYEIETHSNSISTSLPSSLPLEDKSIEKPQVPTLDISTIQPTPESHISTNMYPYQPQEATLLSNLQPTQPQTTQEEQPQEQEQTQEVPQEQTQEENQEQNQEISQEQTQVTL